jgi:DNA topoisomerase IA
VGRRVWVIEAPGKKEAFLSALKQADFGGDQVLATFGRLFDLPRDELGFDVKMLSTPDISSSINWTPKRESQVLKLIDLLAAADEVLIATDTDLEGELIADQVSGLCQLANNESVNPSTVHRVSIHSITADSISAAYQNRAQVSPNKVRAAKARRILDRLLGFRLHSEDDPWRLSIGRIVTPLVKSLQDAPAEAAVVRKRLPDGWNAIIRVDSRQAANSELLVGLLHGLPSPKLVIDRSEPMVHQHKPLTGPEALKLCMRSIAAPPKAIQQSIQDCYEKGRLSYPRSDSRTLDEIGLKWISRMAGKEAVEYDESLALARQSETLERSFDAHHAVIPTGDDMKHSSIPDNYLSLDESVLRVIGNHSMRIGERAERFVREFARLESSDNSSAKWLSALGRWKESVVFVRDTDWTGLQQDPLRHEFSRLPDTSQASVNAWKHPVAQIVMERLMDIGLGRPSTVLGLAEKTFSTYLDQHGQVNGRGRIMIEKVMRRLPELLNVEAAQAIEQAVCDISQNASIASRLSKAWEILKKNPVLLGDDGKVAMDATTPNTPNGTSETPDQAIGRQFSANVFELY